MTNSVSAGWREVYRSLSVPYPDDPVKTGEGARHGPPVPSRGQAWNP